MSPSLATFILLSGYLFSSSASSLARFNMSPGKLSTIKSLATSPIGTTSLDTTALTGYIATAAYSDTLCGAPLIVIFIALDTCYPDSNSTYASVTATSTSITEGVYSDSLCKTVISKNTTDYTDGLCGNDDKVYASTKVFVSARSTFTSSVSMVSERRYKLSDTTCSVTPYMETYIALDKCVAAGAVSFKYSISGSKVQVMVYETTTCSGTPVTASGDIGECTADDYNNYKYGSFSSSPVSSPVSSPATTPSSSTGTTPPSSSSSTKSPTSSTVTSPSSSTVTTPSSSSSTKSPSSSTGTTPSSSSSTKSPSSSTTPSSSTSTTNSPVSAPITSSAAASSDSSKEKACFAGSETLHLESGEVRLLQDIRVGDRVLSANAAGRTSYSDVVYVPHGANSDDALFTHITTARGRDIKMTPSHIILAGPCHSSASLPLKYASSVCVGECVMTVSGEEMVSTVETVQGKGLYTVVTKEEFVVVNGIIASPFAANHMLANLYYNIHRFVYTSAPSLLNNAALHSANEVLGSLIPLTWFSA